MSSIDNIVVAKSGFFIAVDGIERHIIEGETFAAEHPVVQASPEDSFGPIAVDNEIETATATPGQKRNAHVKRTKAPEESKPEPEEKPTKETPDKQAQEAPEESSDFAKAPADVKD